MKTYFTVQRAGVGFALLFVSCSEPEPFPVGPCNSDGETVGGDEVGSSGLGLTPAEVTLLPDPNPPVDDIRPGLPSIDGWYSAPGLDGLVRFATPMENRRFGWPAHTLVVATAIPILSEGATGRAWISVPNWLAKPGRWRRDGQGTIFFERRELTKIQTFAIGHFVEHRASHVSSLSPGIHRPTFQLFGAEDTSKGRRVRVLTESSGGMLLRAMDRTGGILLSGPHAKRQLDVAAPDGFEVVIVSPSAQEVTHDPLTPYDCQNGECEDPNDPLDECNDDVDNDDDGHQDLCDWNCLPHADFGANDFPEARSRVENGKTFAMMGGGTICTELQDTWMVTFGDWALDASEMLAQIRPDVDRPIRYRSFSCWIFEDQAAVQLCQHGPFEVKQGPLEEEECPVIWTGPPVCPPGLEDYPYQPTDVEIQLSASDSALYCGDRNRHYFNELPERGWADLELNTVALGPLGEPANGVIYLTSDTDQLCIEDQGCPMKAGVSFLSPNAAIARLGFAAVSNANPDDWHTLAHETGHLLGLEHDVAVEGFMNDDENSGGLLPNLTEANLERWDDAMDEKGWLPRSSGWFHTGCTGFDECAPLGKPGWVCLNGQRCAEEE
jgi:hypothetical protein